MTPELTPKQHLNKSVYEKIKNEIINFSLKPGQKLLDRHLALQLGVSRTPVREALNRLVQEGFVRQTPGQGYFVKEVTIKDIEDLYEVRKALEILAAQMAVRNINNNQIKRLSEILERHKELVQNGSFRSSLLEEADFHKTIASGSGNHYLFKIMRTIFDQISTYRGIGTLTLQRRKIAYQQHEEIFNSLKEKDTRRLNKILEKHISDAKRDAIERVKKETDMLYLGYHS
ncbi:MAG: GntR family transcriptional regulator [Deltaproteobacteria bacterium]|nr:MAG: GntR family transcriptional regulator [Deltaproteobacteria bacterium]